ncbi:MAG: endolysin [Aphanocapsa feldmannii 277cV]|uniref:Endolysin n=1 Tax=Aphanocapsa feldmannii 277cV TaxID=2507553 RepID=A0A524RQ99_9CHRO|nr:MAG: endolysin [Aphanocapsa feldmannii 277cV]
MRPFAALLTVMTALAAVPPEVGAEWRLPGRARSLPPSMAYRSPLPKVIPFFEITPERRALLNTIRFAEGTWKNGNPVGYRVIYGGGLFHDLQRHPDRVVYRWPYSSAAAGAYQFLPGTWRMAQKAMRLGDFGPTAQDQAALFLIQKRGGLALADRGKMTTDLAAKLAPEWASFPTQAGRSYYGQPVKRFAQLRSFYRHNLALLRRDSRNWSPLPKGIAQPPPALLAAPPRPVSRTLLPLSMPAPPALSRRGTPSLPSPPPRPPRLPLN